MLNKRTMSIIIKKICSVGCMFMSYCCLFLALGNLKTVNQITKNDNIKEFERVLKITDDYDSISNESLYAFFNKKDTSNKLEEAYSKILDSFGERYYEIGEQAVEYIGKCDLNVEFILGGDEARNQEIDEIQQIITPLKSIQLGEKTIENIKLDQKIQMGNNFLHDDYILNGKIISLILGNDYKEEFDLGDTISFFYLGEQFTGKVNAFAKEGTSVHVGEENIVLDNLIIMPSIRTLKSYENTIFAKTLALIRTEGFVLYKNEQEYKNIVEQILQIREDTGVLYRYIEDLSIISQEEKYYMPVGIAIMMLGLSEIIFVVNQLRILNNKKNMVRKSNLIQTILSMSISMVCIGYISYRTITKLKNSILVLNVMRSRSIVIKEVLVIEVVSVSLLVCNALKKQETREKEYENNWHD